MAAIKGYWFFPRIVVDEASAQQISGHARSEPNNLSSIPLLKDDAMFQVLVLGARGAGKSVFLASLFHLLSVQDRKGNNFILSCADLESQSQLRNMFLQISNPDKGWPAGTKSAQEYIFDCEHIKDGQRIKLFKFRYYDFPGGFIAESNATDFGFILAQTRMAHSILVLLDGKKILNLLEDRESPRDEPSIYDDLTMMGTILQECTGKAVHFAITKSDILNLKKYSLTRIKNKLMDHTSFRNIIEQRHGRPTYLLPVSAVGDRFAKFNPETQQMNKRPNGLVEPKHVDMSLTFTLVDYLAKIAADDFSENLDAIIARDYIWRKLVLPLAPLVALLTGPLVGYICHYWGNEYNFFLMAIISAAATLAIGWLASAGGTRIKELIENIWADLDKTRRHFAERQAALKMVINRQIERADHFRRTYPDAAFVSKESPEQ
jgi:hypothetical protein